MMLLGVAHTVTKRVRVYVFSMVFGEINSFSKKYNKLSLCKCYLHWLVRLFFFPGTGYDSTFLFWWTAVRKQNLGWDCCRLRCNFFHFRFSSKCHEWSLVKFLMLQVFQYILLNLIIRGNFSGEGNTMESMMILNVSLSSAERRLNYFFCWERNQILFIVMIGKQLLLYGLFIIFISYAI